jgi:hypothetical protein
MLQKQYQILSTKNYALFKYIGGNRDIDEKRVLSVMDKMKNFPDTVAPAQCNEKYEIIDGQHRLEASRRLGKSFYYYIVKGATIETVRAINDHDPRWSTGEFVNSFSSTGNINYEIYESFEKKYGFGHAINIMLLSAAGGFHNRMLDEFKQGAFVVKDLESAEKTAEMLIEIGKYYAGYKKRSFAIAFTKVAGLPNFDFKTLISKLIYQQKKMVDCTNATHYIALLGELYNYRARKGSTIDVTPILYNK